MEEQKVEVQTQPKWLVPALVLTLVLLTLLATAGWAKAVMGGFSPFPQMRGNGGMMGGMMNVGNGATAGPGFEAMEKMHNDPRFKEMHEQCSKTMGEDHEKMHQQMHGSTTEKTTL